MCVCACVPRQQRHHWCDEAEQVEERLRQEAVHGPVWIRGRGTRGTGGAIAQSNTEEQEDAEDDGEPVHPGLEEEEEEGNQGEDSEKMGRRGGGEGTSLFQTGVGAKL